MAQLFNLFDTPPTLAAEVATSRAAYGHHVAPVPGPGPVPGSGKTWNGKAWTDASVKDMRTINTPIVAGAGAQGLFLDPWQTRREQAELREAVDEAAPSIAGLGRRRL